jgi:hypothetical protein
MKRGVSVTEILAWWTGLAKELEFDIESLEVEIKKESEIATKY